MLSAYYCFVTCCFGFGGCFVLTPPCWSNRLFAHSIWIFMSPAGHSGRHFDAFKELSTAEIICSVLGVLKPAAFNPFTFSPLLCSEPNLLVRACNQLGQFLQHRETNLRYLALESMCTLASSEFSHEAVKTHIETVINALKVNICVQSVVCVVCSPAPRLPTPPYTLVWSSSQKVCLLVQKILLWWQNQRSAPVGTTQALL